MDRQHTHRVDEHEANAPTIRETGSWVWSALVAETAIGVSVVTTAGRVLYANDQLAQMIHPTYAAGDLVGRAWDEYMPPDWVAEWLPVLRRVAGSRQSVMKRSIWRGTQFYTTVRAIGEPGDADTRLLMISRPVSSAEEPVFLAAQGIEKLPADGIDLGPLDVLTTRELEVLALLGQGLSVEDTARLLFRSPETVKSHRKSIADKLGTSDRMKLASLAQQAGLRVADAAAPRFRQSGNSRQSASSARPGESPSAPPPVELEAKTRPE